MLKRTKHLTELNPALEAKINRTMPGQASWAEPTFTATCGQCAFWLDGTKHKRRCAKFTALMFGRPGRRCRARLAPASFSWSGRRPIVALDHAANAGMHTFAERGVDLYETPPCAVEALLQVELLPLWVWEPAAGNGAVARVLRDYGHVTITSDVVDYGGLDFVRDFLAETKLLAGCEAIVTNPPYKLANQFAEHALDIAPKVCLLLRLAFLESIRRTDVLEHRGLRAVHVFRRRLPMMHRDSWTGPRASSAIAFAWFCWDRDYRGATTIDRISWERD
jgi:hypothetical protein